MMITLSHHVSNSYDLLIQILTTNGTTVEFFFPDALQVEEIQILITGGTAAICDSPVVEFFFPDALPLEDCEFSHPPDSR